MLATWAGDARPQRPRDDLHRKKRLFHHSVTHGLGLLRRFVMSKRAQERVKSAWRREGFYKDEASIVCHTVLILCTVLEKTEKTDCNVTAFTVHCKHSDSNELTVVVRKGDRRLNPLSHLVIHKNRYGLCCSCYSAFKLPRVFKPESSKYKKTM